MHLRWLRLTDAFANGGYSLRQNARLLPVKPLPSALHPGEQILQCGQEPGRGAVQGTEGDAVRVGGFTFGHNVASTGGGGFDVRHRFLPSSSTYGSSMR